MASLSGPASLVSRPPRLDEARYLIADVATLTGVSPPQLRSWEQAGLVHPLRSARAIRLYTREDVARVRLIKRSLRNRGRRGSVQRLVAHLAQGTLQPEAQDYAGLEDSAVPTPDAVRGHSPLSTGAGQPVPAALLWQRVVEVLPSLVVVCDRSGTLIYMNPALQALLPADHDAAQDGATHQGSPFSGALDALPLRWTALTSTQHRDIPVLLRGPDQAERRTLWTVTPLHSPDDELVGAVAVGRDITAESQQAQAYEDAVARVAHDLRSPLTTILGNVQLARRRVAAWVQPGRSSDEPTERDETVLSTTVPLDSRRLLRHLEVAETGVLEVIRTMETVLDAAVAAAGGLVNQLEPGGVDLHALAQAAIAQARTLSSRHAITLVAPARLPLLVGDRVHLRLLLDNLLSNAVKYAPEGGPIIVRLTAEVRLFAAEDAAPGADSGAPDSREPPSWALLRVTDTGLGIPTADIPFVFERYWRASGATRLIRGTGLGLFTCRAIAAAHGGDLWIERTAVAAGPPGGSVSPDAMNAAEPHREDQTARWHGTVIAVALPLLTPPMDAVAVAPAGTFPGSDI